MKSTRSLFGSGGILTDRLRKTNFRRALAAATVLAAGGAALLLNSCSSVGPQAAVAPLQISGAHYVGNQVCAQCHAQIVHEFPASPHARLVSVKAGLPGGTSCEACHGPGSKHVESGGAAQFIINPGKNPDACFRCHLQVRAEFELPYHHPVVERHMSCADCHDPHGTDIYKTAGGLAMARRNDTCAQCHRSQARPFVFEHPAVREGCTVCHNPHGSVNRAMLTEADDNLCLRCHAENQSAGGRIFIGNVDHTPLLQMGACWSCHTAIHGSDADPRLRY